MEAKVKNQVKSTKLTNLIKIILLVVFMSLLVLSLASCQDAGSDPIVYIYVHELGNYQVRVGSALDLSLIELHAVTKSGKIKKDVPVTVDMISEYDTSEYGIKKIIITYQKLQTELLIEYVLPSVRNISFAQKPDFLSITEGMPLSLDGVVLFVEYDDGATTLISNFDESNVRGFDRTLKPKNKGEYYVIQIVYYGKTLDIDLVVEKKRVKEIKIIKEQNIRSYIVRQDYNPFGIEMELTYNNGEKEVIIYEVDAEAERLPIEAEDSVNLQTYLGGKKFINNQGITVFYNFERPHAYSPVLFRYEYEYEDASSEESIIVAVDATVECRVENKILTKIELMEPTSLKTMEVDLGDEKIRYLFAEEMPEGVKIDPTTASVKVVYSDLSEEIVRLDDDSISLYVEYDQSLPSNLAIDKREYLFQKSDKKLYINFANFNKIAEINLSITEAKAKKLEIVDPHGILQKDYYNGEVFDDNLLRYNVLYNNGHYKHFIYDESVIELTDQYYDWSDIHELDLRSSKMLVINPSLPAHAVTLQEIKYQSGSVEAFIQVKVHPRLVVEEQIYIKEPEQNYFALSEIIMLGMPSVRDAYVSFVAKGSKKSAIRYYFTEAEVKYINTSGVEVGAIVEVGTYIAQVEVFTNELDFPFTATYEIIVGELEIAEIEIGELDNGNFSPLDLAQVNVLESIQNFSLSNFAVRRKIANKPEYEEYEVLEPSMLYQVRKSTQSAENNVFHLVSGTNYLNIRYYGFIKQIKFYVKSEETRAIEVLQLPKTVYMQNEEFSIQDLIVARITYEDRIFIVDDPENLSSEYEWHYSGFDSSQLGTQTIKITYTISGQKSVSTSFDVEVINKTVKSIEVYDPHNVLLDFDNKKVIPLKYGDILSTTFVKTEFNPVSGKNEDIICPLKMNVTYLDNSTATIALLPNYIDAKDWNSVLMPQGSNYLLQKAKVKYGGVETNLYIMISNKIEIYTISTFQVPTRSNFIEGEEIDVSGGRYSISYVHTENSEYNYRVLRKFNEGYLEIIDYNKNVSIYSDYVEQVVKYKYLISTLEGIFTLRTYKKIMPQFYILGLISEYGSESNVNVSINKVADFAVPECSIMYYVNNNWQEEAPLYPGKYTIRVTINGNEYYHSREDESFSFTINKKKIVVVIGQDGKEKEYSLVDPRFSEHVIFSTNPLAGDKVNYRIVRADDQMQSVGKYLFSIEPIYGEDNANHFYDFIISPSYFTIKPKQLDIDTLEATNNVSGEETILIIKYGTTTIGLEQYSLFNDNGEPMASIINLAPGNYYIIFKENYQLYRVENGAKVEIENNRWDFNI